jgi:hypothetical protein
MVRIADHPLLSLAYAVFLHGLQNHLSDRTTASMRAVGVGATAPTHSDRLRDVLLVHHEPDYGTRTGVVLAVEAPVENAHAASPGYFLCRW